MFKREPGSVLLNLGDGRFVFGVDVNRPTSWRDRAIPPSRIAWDRWDADQRRRLGFWAGLSGPGRTNTTRHWNLAARHWPHRLCWSWVVWASVASRGDRWARMGLHFTRRYRSGQITFGPLAVGLSWQDSDWMVGCGPLRETAPRIIWQHEVAQFDDVTEGTIQ